MLRLIVQVRLAILALALWPLPGLATAPEARRISSAEDWSVFQTVRDGERLCWAATTPFEMSSGTAQLNPYVLYTVGTDVLSITFQGASAPALAGYLSVGSKEYGLFFQGSHGWMSTLLPDQVFEKVAGNQQFAYVSVGENSFSFSLRGFYSAVGQARVACDLL